MTRGLTSWEGERVGLESIGGQLPFPVKGIDSDNDSVFINDTLTQYCAERGIELHLFLAVPQERPDLD